MAHWILQRHAVSFDEMTNLPAELRRRLQQLFTIGDPELVEATASADGARKFLFALDDGASVEGVAMPEDRKLTLCLSSQAGCALGCRFCVTGVLGPGRNLRPDEIVGQYRVMLRATGVDSDRVNIVFMGMGEPLLNTENLGTALEVLCERVSPKRITVSTAGILPGIRWLAGRQRRPKLAISLNAPDQDRRAEIMPISRRYPLDELMREVRSFPLERGRRVTFEYVLIRGFNDAECRRLAPRPVARRHPEQGQRHSPQRGPRPPAGMAHARRGDGRSIRPDPGRGRPDRHRALVARPRRGRGVRSAQGTTAASGA